MTAIDPGGGVVIADFAHITRDESHSLSVI